MSISETVLNWIESHFLLFGIAVLFGLHLYHRINPKRLCEYLRLGKIWSVIFVPAIALTYCVDDQEKKFTAQFNHCAGLYESFNPEMASKAFSEEGLSDRERDEKINYIHECMKRIKDPKS